ncbi:uncharacterized protein LOC127266499 [Andrographis paniculata]|uniref:uncharacterized protein LOC127266499 n=1 Tax=Andrographis paniculata TaxID=175694 RepID=UPI0021E8D95D|nr:uncharacterized protein LOC127266499 [Andrographis paniculata]
MLPWERLRRHPRDRRLPPEKIPKLCPPLQLSPSPPSPEKIPKPPRHSSFCRRRLPPLPPRQAGEERKLREKATAGACHRCCRPAGEEAAGVAPSPRCCRLPEKKKKKERAPPQPLLPYAGAEAACVATACR